MYSIYFDGVESTAQYSWVLLNRLLFYSYSSRFLDMYFNFYIFWKVTVLLLEYVFSVLFPPLSTTEPREHTVDNHKTF